MIGHIYKITNLINNKIYVGQTTKSLEERFKSHVYGAKVYIKTGKLPYNHNSRIIPALAKYGYENFKIESIHEVDDDENIDELEKYYIKILNAQDPLIGYNIAEGGNKPPSRLGYKHTNDAKEKMSNSARKRKWYTNGVIDIMIDPNNGIPDGFRPGRTNSNTKGEKNGMWGKKGFNYGKHLSNETKKKLSETKKMNNLNKKKMWFTNDIIEIQLDMNVSQTIPDGFRKGRLESHLHKPQLKQVEVIDLVENSTTVYENILELMKNIKISYPTVHYNCNTNKIVKNRYKFNYIN